MTKRPDRRAFSICECGDHAFTSLTKGFTVLVSPEDIPAVGARNWSAFTANRRVYYAQRHTSENGKKRHVYMHRVILGAGAGEVVDHINHNGLDNRRSNIRLCDQVANNGNMRIMERKRKKLSRFKGVSRNHGTWRANLNVRGRRVFSANFATEVEAALAYDAALIAHQGPNAATNKKLGLYHGL